MPRISRELANQKESFVMGLVADNSAITNKEVQDAVKAKFGGAMNANKIKELRSRVAGTSGQASPIVTSAEVAPATEAPAAAPVETEVATEVAQTVTETVVTPTPAPEPLSAVPAVIVPMTEVVDASGTHIEPPAPQDPNAKEVGIRPGLVEVIKPEVPVAG